MSKLLIQGARLVDAASELDGQFDVLIEDGSILEVAPEIQDAGAQLLDARGMTMLPGLVDLHCHLRDPGYEYKEDIASGTQAAAKGGFTSVLCMANTDPVNDSAAVTEYIYKRAATVGNGVQVYPIGAVSKGLKGEELAPIGEMKDAGVVALSDDGRPVENSQLLRQAMTYASAFDLTIYSHSEDMKLVDGGVMNEGEVSTRIGLRGATHAAEEVMLARDILLSETLHLPIHICHVSTKGGVQLLREAKARGVRVTAETAPHYLYATDAWAGEYDPMTRVNPPLRTTEDQEALIAGLLDGTIDCIATDHAPHHLDEKRVEYPMAASGISGFETAFGICYTVLVQREGIPLSQLVRWMCHRPAQIAQLPAGAMSLGMPADFILVDLKKQWTVQPEAFLSKGKNTPFGGCALTGQVLATYVAGKEIYRYAD